MAVNLRSPSVTKINLANINFFIKLLRFKELTSLIITIVILYLNQNVYHNGAVWI